MGDIIRPESHETDTAARRIVPGLLPRAWEHREPGGPDYGVDMQVELFDGGRATGGTLLLQIKGTAKGIDETGPILFDIPVRTLKYAEMFVVPFLCVLCPVDAVPHRAYFVWLQDHIKVALDAESPTWRENASTVRVTFSPEDRLPEAHAGLGWVAGEPQRVRDWTRLAWLQGEIRWALDGLDAENIGEPVAAGKARAARPLVGQIRHLKSLSRHPAGVMLARHAAALEGLLGLLERGGPLDAQGREVPGGR